MIVYIGVKFLVYALWCWVGLRTLFPGSEGPASALKLGIFRLGLGVLFGVGVFLAAGSVSNEGLLMKYVLIYVPIRMIEWGIVARIMQTHKGFRPDFWKTVLWCIGGVLVSFAADGASPEGVAGHFCVGRCLC